MEFNRTKFNKLQENHNTLSQMIKILKKNERTMISERENHLNQTKEKVK